MLSQPASDPVRATEPRQHEPKPTQPSQSGSDSSFAVVGGGAESFTDFYDREYEGQVRRAYLMLGSSAVAHDVVADAFVQILKRWDKLDSPGPYLNRCVLNGCRDAARKARRELLLIDRKGESALAEATSGVGEATVELTEALLHIPFKQRAAIVLRYYAGFSEREIAESLGCRPGTVGSHIHRGLASLRTGLAQ